MRTLIVITLSIMFLVIVIDCAKVSIDRITVRDCARGIKGACEEMRRLDLK